jgi:hypothetical protein
MHHRVNPKLPKCGSRSSPEPTAWRRRSQRASPSIGGGMVEEGSLTLLWPSAACFRAQQIMHSPSQYPLAGEVVELILGLPLCFGRDSAARPPQQPTKSLGTMSLLDGPHVRWGRKRRGPSVGHEDGEELKWWWKGIGLTVIQPKFFYLAYFQSMINNPGHIELIKPLKTSLESDLGVRVVFQPPRQARQNYGIRFMIWWTN